MVKLAHTYDEIFPNPLGIWHDHRKELNSVKFGEFDEATEALIKLKFITATDFAFRCECSVTTARRHLGGVPYMTMRDDDIPFNTKYYFRDSAEIVAKQMRKKLNKKAKKNGHGTSTSDNGRIRKRDLYAEIEKRGR